MKKFNILIVAISLLAAGCTNVQHHELYNESASHLKTSEIGFNPLEGNVISTFVDVRDTTMSTLYGNDSAASHAEQQASYSDGDVLSLVTWKQREDPYWFGGNIPDSVAAIEIVRFQSDGPIYSIYSDDLAESYDRDKRIRFITDLRRSEFP